MPSHGNTCHTLYQKLIELNISPNFSTLSDVARIMDLPEDSTPSDMERHFNGEENIFYSASCIHSLAWNEEDEAELDEEDDEELFNIHDNREDNNLDADPPTAPQFSVEYCIFYAHILMRYRKRAEKIILLNNPRLNGGILANLSQETASQDDIVQKLQNHLAPPLIQNETTRRKKVLEHASTCHNPPEGKEFNQDILQKLNSMQKIRAELKKIQNDISQANEDARLAQLGNHRQNLNARAQAQHASDEEESRQRKNPTFPRQDEENEPLTTDRIGHLEAIFAVSWADTANPGLPCVKDIPFKFTIHWALAVAELEKKLQNAIEAEDEKKITCMLKWWHLLPVILLRKARKTHGRNQPCQDHLKVRFELFRCGKYDKLIELFLRHIAQFKRAKGPSTRQHSTDSAKERRVFQYAKQGLLSQANRLAQSGNLADLKDPACADQMKAKLCQPRQVELPGKLPACQDANDEPNMVTVETRAIFEKLAKRKGTGPNGCRNEFLTSLTLPCVSDDPIARKAIGYWDYFAMLFANDKLPYWFYSLELTGRLIPIEKDTPNDWRPLMLGNVGTRAIISQIVRDRVEDAGALLTENGQVCYAVPSGGQVLATCIYLHIKNNPTQAVFNLDMINAFGVVDRNACLTAVLDRRGKDSLGDLAPLVLAILSPETKIAGLEDEDAKCSTAKERYQTIIVDQTNISN